MRTTLLLLTLLSPAALHAAENAGLTLTLAAGPHDRIDPLVAIAHGVTAPAAATGAIFEWDGEAKPVAADLDPADNGKLWFQLPGTLKAGSTATLRLKEWLTEPAPPAEEPDANFVVTGPSGKPAFTYQAKVFPAPEGESPLFARSGFIHPICAPDGTVLNDIRPPDHFHHVGVWHAWTKAKYQGKDIDFWNVKDEKKQANPTGLIRFREYLWRHRGKAWTGFQAGQDHIAWPGKPEETKALAETLTVRFWSADGMNIIDYTIDQKNVSKDPLELEVYRYGGGVCFRGRRDWQLANSDYLTSEGKTRADAHTTRARWVVGHGTIESGHAGVALLGHPANIDAPQHLRTWQGDYGGAIFANFVPTQEKPATIAPGASLSLRYRVVSFQGKPDSARLDALWNDFAAPVEATAK